MIFVLDDDLGLTKKVNPCIVVPPANSRKTFKTTISNWNLTEMQHHINLLSLAHWLIFDFLSKNYLRKVKNLKIIFTNVYLNLKSRWNNSAKMFSDVFLLYSTAPQLRYPQLHYFRSHAILNWVKKKFELSYFFAHVTRYVFTIRPRSQWSQDPSQPKIPVSPQYCFK